MVAAVVGVPDGTWVGVGVAVGTAVGLLVAMGDGVIVFSGWAAIGDGSFAAADGSVSSGGMMPAGGGWVQDTAVMARSVQSKAIIDFSIEYQSKDTPDNLFFQVQGFPIAIPIAIAINKIE